MNSRILIFIFLILISSSSKASSVKYGVSFKCDKSNSSFSLKPIVETESSNEFPMHDVTAPPGFTTLKNGRLQNIECRLGSDNIELVISVYGPQSQGMGQGAGVIIIEQLLFNNKNVIKGVTNFNWQVMPKERVLTELHIKNQPEVKQLELCYSNGWKEDSAYSDLKCEISIIPNG